MKMTFEDRNNTRIITVAEPRIDSAIAIQFKDQMREFTDDGPNRFIVDMSQVNFLDSSGLGAVVAAMKQVGANRSMELAGLTETVAKVFRLTRMDTVFKIHESVSNAVGSVFKAS